MGLLVGLVLLGVVVAVVLKVRADKKAADDAAAPKA